MSRDERGDKWMYYGDAQLGKQLASMHELALDAKPSDVPEYRLCPELHYLKMVRPTDYDGRSAELMEGMYIPLGLVDLMLGSSEDTTRNGNLRIMWRDDKYPTQRHLNNSQFTQLFRDGWIGSCGTSTDPIRRLVEMLFDSDELVTIAVDETTRPRVRS